MNRLFLFCAVLLLTAIPCSLSAQGTWELVSGYLPNWIRDLYFIDALEGWAAGGGYGTPGYIFHTVDGGVTWEIQPDPLNENNTSVYFLDNLHGFVGTSYSNILRTTNGGITWEYYDIPEHTPLRAFDFVDDNYGFAVGGDILYNPPYLRYYILKTVNSGESWDRIHYGSDGISYDVAFANYDTGLVANYGVDDAIFRTVDGGDNWEIINIDDSTLFYSIEHL